jgi:hypothetical protein
MEFIYFLDSETQRLITEGSPDANVAMEIKNKVLEQYSAS